MSLEEKIHLLMMSVTLSSIQIENYTEVSSTNTILLRNESSSTESMQVGGDSAGGRSLLLTILLVLTFTTLCVLTVTGNLLVLISFRVEKRLRTVTNYFLFSLAISDLLIGIFSIPMYAIYLLLDGWIFGPVLCDVWLALDYSISGTSALHLLVISLDRFFSITRPLTYRPKRTAHRVVVAILTVWTIPTVMWTPIIVSWPRFIVQRTVPSDACYIQFLENPVLTMVTAAFAFYLPVAIMVGLYLKVWWITRRRMKDLQDLQANQKLFFREPQVTLNSSFKSSKTKLESIFSRGCMKRKENEGGENKSRNVSNMVLVPEDSVAHISGDVGDVGGASTRCLSTTSPQDCIPISHSTSGCGGSQTSSMGCTPKSFNNHANACSTPAQSNHHVIHFGKSQINGFPLTNQAKKKTGVSDKKAAKTLSLILLAFLVTWFPYNIFVVLKGFGVEVPTQAYTFAYWACYVNSLLNPFCYALANPLFRQTFSLLISCQWGKLSAGASRRQPAISYMKNMGRSTRPLIIQSTAPVIKRDTHQFSPAPTPIQEKHSQLD